MNRLVPLLAGVVLAVVLATAGGPAHAQSTLRRRCDLGFDFERSDVSKLDHFHPSLSGQADLARVSWAQSWWG